jgi:hypothetical protein
VAVVGTGTYADPALDLGTSDGAPVPRDVRLLELTNLRRTPGTLQGEAVVPPGYGLRIVGSQTRADGRPWRVSGGAPPSGTPLGSLLRLDAAQRGRAIPLVGPGDRAIWSGLSWMEAEAAPADLDARAPVVIRYAVSDPRGGTGELSLRAYAVAY